MMGEGQNEDFEIREDSIDDRNDGKRPGRVAALLKGHWLEILLLLGMGGYCGVLSWRSATLMHENVALKRQREALTSLLGASARKICELEERCQEKDSWFLAMTAEALRHGSSFAGKCMRDRRDYLKERV